jgi:hypothetical protein
MLIVGRMTSHAAVGQLLGRSIYGMALLAAQGGVAARQREARLATMVEVGLRPCPRAVAVPAVVSQPAPVNVVDPMTVDAGVRLALEPIAGMAESAADPDVRSLQWEARLRVIEARL